MSKVKVNLDKRSYDIVIGYDMLAKLPAMIKRLKVGSNAVIITNPGIKKLHGNVMAKALKQNGFAVKFFEVPDGEKSKAAKVACDLVNKIAAFDVMKSPFIIALGGGVIGDLAGFVAASYKRGIPYIQVPTTLLAQVDSAIGGKTGVDLPVGKNLMGAVYQPRLVWSDGKYLTTLSARQVKNGLAEVIKYGIIADKKLFADLSKDYKKALDLDPKMITKIIKASSAIKANVVERDELDVTGIRAILNFGHTVGHAIEAAQGYEKYQHGEAVGLGMRVAAEISVSLGLLSQKASDQINTLISNVGLPESIEGLTLAKILKPMQHDKKFLAGQNRFVLATSIGSVKLVSNIKLDVIKAAIKKYL